MRKSKAALFLMELLIVLLFFSIACGICVQLFTYAHLTNKQSKEYSNSNVIFTNIAEEFYHGNRFDDNTNQTLSFDSYLVECDDNHATYVANISFENKDNMSICHIEVTSCESNTTYISEDIIKYERRTLGDE